MSNTDVVKSNKIPVHPNENQETETNTIFSLIAFLFVSFRLRNAARKFLLYGQILKHLDFYYAYQNITGFSHSSQEHDKYLTSRSIAAY
jgi:hypothetical protein